METVLMRLLSFPIDTEKKCLIYKKKTQHSDVEMKVQSKSVIIENSFILVEISQEMN